MKVLLLGGSGNISSSVTKLLLSQGHDVYLFNRGNNLELQKYGAKYIIGDMRSKADAESKLKGNKFDVVANFFNFTVDHVEQDFEIFRSNIGQYIFISTCAVYQRPLKNYIVTEDTPAKNPFNPYARNKLACEHYLLDRYRDSDFPVTIVRASHTYGITKFPGPLLSWQDKHWALADRMLKGKEIVTHGDGRALWVLTHSDDFARGFVGLVGNHRSIGQTFHITSDEVLSWDSIMTIFAHALGVEPRIVHMTSEYIEENWPKFKNTLQGDKADSIVFDNSKIKRFVPGFQAQIPLEKGIRMSIDYYMEHPELRDIDDTYDREMDALIDGYKRRMTMKL